MKKFSELKQKSECEVTIKMQESGEVNELTEVFVKIRVKEQSEVRNRSLEVNRQNSEVLLKKKFKLKFA